MGIFDYFFRKKAETHQATDQLSPSTEAVQAAEAFAESGNRTSIVRDYGMQSRTVREALEVLHEAAPTLPGLSLFLEQSGFRSMNRSIRDMNDAARQNLLVRCETTSVMNTVVSRGMTIRTDLIVSEGFKAESTAKNEKNKERCQAILDTHWDYNAWDAEMFTRVFDFGVCGEMVRRLPPLVRKVGKKGNQEIFNPGMFRCGLVLPHLVRGCSLTPWNYEILDKLYLQDYTYEKLNIVEKTERIELKIITDEAISHKEFGNIRGDVFYGSVNRRPGTTRGLSDLATIVDWADLHDKAFMSDIERVELMKRFIWDVTLEGASPKQIEEYARKLKIGGPPPGSVRVHNQKETWDAVSPDLKTGELGEMREQLFLHMWGGMGLPRHWYVDSKDIVRACHSEDTETLTIDGWKTLDQLSENDILATVNKETNEIEYQKPDKMFVYEHSGKMVHFKNRDFDVLVTPEHKMWAMRELNDKSKMTYTEVRADEMLRANKFTMLLAGKWNGGFDEEVFILPSVGFGNGRAIYPEISLPGDLWAEFLGYFVSEGCVYKPPVYEVSVSQKKPGGVEKFRTLFEKMNSHGFDFTESQDKNGCYRWRTSDKALNQWLRENCGVVESSKAPFKRLPSMVWGWTSRRQQILLDALVEGDGSRGARSETNHRGCAYYTTSMQLVDDVQRLCCHLGLASKIRTCYEANGNRKKCTAIHILDHGKAGIRRAHGKNANSFKESGIVEVDGYQGRVYCFEVKNHLFITRRNGKTAISHNSSDNMTDPTFAWARTRKRLVSQLLELECRYAMQVAYEGGRLQGVPVEELGVRIVSRDPDRRGFEGVGAAWNDIANSLTLLQQQELVDKKSAANIVRVVLSNYGFEIDPKLLELENKKKEEEQAAGQVPGQPPQQTDPQEKTGGKGIMNSANPTEAIMNEAYPWLERQKAEDRDLLRRF